MAHRWQVARLLEEGLPYLEISRRTHASTTTVTRVAHWLRHGEGGYRLAARPAEARAERPPDDRRPREGPAARAVDLAARRRGARPGGAGRARARVPVPQRAGRRAARARGRRPRVRAGRRRRLRDHRRRPRRASAARTSTELLKLGFGGCRLEAAVPEESPIVDARGARRRARRDGLSATRARAARGARDRRRARRRHGLGRGRAAARPRRRDRRSRLERQHAADERPALARLALRVRGGADRARRGRPPEPARGDPALRRRGAARTAT